LREAYIKRSLILGLIAAVSILATQCARQQDAPPPPRPPVVEVAPVIQKSVPIYGSWPATLEGYVNAQIQPEVTGYLITQDYHEGTYVQKNQVLFEIDPRPFQAVLDQAKAQVAQAEAQLGTATLNVKRDIPEAKAHAIPQSQLDNDTQAKLAGEAAVQAAHAAVEQAQLNLGYTKVRSLIGGIAGIARVQVGNLVTPASVLTGVSQVDPIKAYFQISGAEWLRMGAEISSGAANLLSGAKRIPLSLVLANGQIFPYAGRILFAGRAMNLQTGTIQIVGAFPNPLRILRPQETTTVRAVTELLRSALLVPQPAVMQLQGSYLVAVVGPDNRVSIRNVQVGPQVGTLWIITQGLQLRERVVVVGAEKVRDGMVVTPHPYTAAGAKD
jgi:RND family efflux transporter MFP subunit